MSVTCIAFIAISLDGYIAKPGGDIAWLNDPRYDIEGEDFGYDNHFQRIDALLMGRNTFELAISFDEWPYYGKHVYVLSNSNPKIPEHLSQEASVVSGELTDVLQALERQGKQKLYIDGGKTIQGFLRENLLDEITITQIPILLGNGIPLFAEVDNDIHLQLLQSKSYPNGLVQNRYSIIHASTSE